MPREIIRSLRKAVSCFERGPVVLRSSYICRSSRHFSSFATTTSGWRGRVLQTLPAKRFSQFLVRSCRYLREPSLMTNSSLPGLVVVDFDETCTTSDTTSLIIEAALRNVTASAVEAGGGSPFKENEREDKAKWLVDNYVRERSLLFRDILKEDAASREEYDEDWLSCFTERLSGFDRHMNVVVEDSGILEGITRQQLEEAGSGVELRPGCNAALMRLLSSGCPLHVISVNWSASLVSAALRRGLERVGRNGVRGGLLSHYSADKMSGTSQGFSTHGSPWGVSRMTLPEVHANELEFGEDGKCTGNMDKVIECGTDKARVFDEILLDEASCGSRGPSVYIGDSVTDLFPLLAADVGIIMGSNPLVRRVVAVSGIQLQSLDCAVLVESQCCWERPVLFHTDSWTEVEQFLFAKAGSPDGDTSNGNGL